MRIVRHGSLSPVNYRESNLRQERSGDEGTIKQKLYKATKGSFGDP